MKSVPSLLKTLWTLFWRSGATLVGLVILFVVYTNLAAKRAGQGKLFNEVAEVPPQAVGLVFGTTDKVGERDNLYFTHRIDAAVALWEAQKVQCFLVSGDNREKYYNEPNMMREALIERGVPKEKIVRDFAGLRTLDSVVRAKQIFQAPSVVLISQKFHNERAAYLARAEGLPYVGYNAEDVEGEAGLKTRLREIAARVVMWLDVRVLDTAPRHLGPLESLPIARDGSGLANLSEPEKKEVPPRNGQ
jgi:SanA protein